MVAPVNQEGHLPAVGRSHGKKGQARDSRGSAKPPIVGSRPAPHGFFETGEPCGAVRHGHEEPSASERSASRRQRCTACSGHALLGGGGGQQ
jgi:hypothetical protein